MNFYEILGVPQDATSDEINKAYLKIMRKHHPDVSDDPNSAEIAKQANEAKTVLLDEKKRKDYDDKLRYGTPDNDRVDDTVDEEPDEPFEPSWGSESTWDIPTFGGVYNDDGWGDANPYSQPSNITVPPPVDIPEKFVKDTPKLLTCKPDAMVALLLTLVAPFVASLVFFQNLWSFMLGACFFAAIGVFVYARSWSYHRLIKWPYQLAISMVIIMVASYLNSYLPDIVKNYVPMAIVSLGVPFVVAQTFWRFMELRKIVKPKSLAKNNSFGECDGSTFDQMIEDLIQQFWDIKALRVFRMNNFSFSHMLFFDNKVILLKAVVMDTPGSLVWSGGSLIQRVGQKYTTILSNLYGESLTKVLAVMPKGLKVYPMVVAFPDGFLLDLDNNGAPAAIVGSQDAVSMISKILVENVEEPVINHTLITQAVERAASIY